MFSKINDSIYIDEDYAYKPFSDVTSFLKERRRNIQFLLQNELKHSPRIIKEVIENNKFRGYIMEFKKNSFTFRDAISKGISFEQKINIIFDVYEALKILHIYNFYLGDIHSDNLLITDAGEGMIIDLDEMRYVGDEFKFSQLYSVKPNNNSPKINIVSKYTDNVKLLISSLSLIFDTDLERYIDKKSHDINLEFLYNDFIVNLEIPELNEYFLKLINAEDIDYFDSILDSIIKSQTKEK